MFHGIPVEKGMRGHLYYAKEGLFVKAVNLFGGSAPLVRALISTLLFIMVLLLPVTSSAADKCDNLKETESLRKALIAHIEEIVLLQEEFDEEGGSAALKEKGDDSFSRISSIEHRSDALSKPCQDLLAPEFKRLNDTLDEILAEKTPLPRIMPPPGDDVPQTCRKHLEALEKMVTEYIEMSKREGDHIRENGFTFYAKSLEAPKQTNLVWLTITADGVPDECRIHVRPHIYRLNDYTDASSEDVADLKPKCD